MCKNNKLEIGKAYTTKGGFKVTPIATISDKTALFTTNQFPVTPFVVWIYAITGDDTIDLYNGNYYPTLEAALINQHPHFAPWHFRVTYFCKNCGVEHKYTVHIDACTSVQDIVEQFEDLRVCPDCGTHTNRHIKSLAIAQSYNYYVLPLTV